MSFMKCLMGLSILFASGCSAHKPAERERLIIGDIQTPSPAGLYAAGEYNITDNGIIESNRKANEHE